MCGIRRPVEQERLGCFSAGVDEFSGLLDVQPCEVGLSNLLVDGKVLIVSAEGHPPSLYQTSCNTTPYPHLHPPHSTPSLYTPSLHPPLHTPHSTPPTPHPPLHTPLTLLPMWLTFLPYQRSCTQVNLAVAWRHRMVRSGSLGSQTTRQTRASGGGTVVGGQGACVGV